MANKQIFSASMSIENTILFIGVTVIMCLLINSIPLRIIISFIGGYFWFAYTLRIIRIYNNGIEIFFPLRFKPFYQKRKVFLVYEEIKEIIQNLGRPVETKIVLRSKSQFLGKEKNNFYIFLLDTTWKKKKNILLFLKEKGVTIIIKPEELTPDELKNYS